MKKYFCSAWQERIKRKSKQLFDSGAASSLWVQGTFHVSAARICHFGLDVHCLPSSWLLCLQLVASWLLALSHESPLKTTHELLFLQPVGLLVGVVGAMHHDCFERFIEYWMWDTVRPLQGPDKAVILLVADCKWRYLFGDQDRFGYCNWQLNWYRHGGPVLWGLGGATYIGPVRWRRPGTSGGYETGW